MTRHGLVALSALISFILIGSSAGASAAGCGIRAADIAATSPYFSRFMHRVEDRSDERSVTFAHNDDPRMLVVFTVSPAAKRLTDVTRSDYVEAIEEQAQNFAIGVRMKGRWAEASVFPYDPVAWRTVHEQDVEGLGAARISHMEINLTPDCVFVADSVSPVSMNLRSRWVEVHQAVADLRETARRYVIPIAFVPERNVPSGWVAVLGGFGLPTIVVALLYLLMGQMRNLDPPETTTRIVLGCSALIAFGALVMQRNVYFVGLRETMTFVDNSLLLGGIGIASGIGSAMRQRGALIGLLSTLIGGISIGVATVFRWTPDQYVSGSVSGAFILLGISGFYAWSEASSAARLRRATEGRKSE